jgi:hypothetical protein
MQSTKDLREYALGSANNGAYDRCSAPRSAAEAEEDLDGFARAVYRLRMEYRIPELVLGASVPVDGGTDRATTMMILGNRAHTAPAGVDWAAARDAVCTARAALEGVGDPGILGDVRRLVEEAKDLRAAQDAVAGLGTALRSGGLWCGRQRDAVNSMVHALGGEPPRDEWRWTGRAGCDWEGAENALTFAAVGADAWRAIRSRRRAEAVDRLRAALLDSGERSVHRSAVLDAIDSLTGDGPSNQFRGDDCLASPDWGYQHRRCNPLSPQVG